VLPFRRIFTRNVIITLLSRGVLAAHIGCFQNILYIFLSTPRAKDGNQESKIFFTGGLALPPNRIGIVLSIIGSIGIFFQLMAYPPLAAKFGTIICYRTSLLLFPFAYFIAPFMAIMPSSTLPPLPSSGIFVWGGILAVLFLHVLGRTFAMPSATILVNNCCPHPSVLSTVHGIAQTVSSGMRMLGPLFGGWSFALALNWEFVAMPFWAMMVFSVFAATLSWWVYEGDGHEIKLEGEEDEAEEEEKLMVQRHDIEISAPGMSRRESNVHPGRATP
jgi:MFS family permease